MIIFNIGNKIRNLIPYYFGQKLIIDSNPKLSQILNIMITCEGMSFLDDSCRIGGK